MPERLRKELDLTNLLDRKSFFLFGSRSTRKSSLVHQQFSGLPAVYLSDAPDEELYARVDTYLKKEIPYESTVQNIPRFSAFLKTAALTNSQRLNFTQIAGDIGLSPSTVREYYSLLQDTLH